jgi:hypothetical protein
VKAPFLTDSFRFFPSKGNYATGTEHRHRRFGKRFAVKTEAHREKKEIEGWEEVRED